MSFACEGSVEEKLQSVEDELLVRAQLISDQEKRVEEEVKKLEALQAAAKSLNEYKEQLLAEVATANGISSTADRQAFLTTSDMSKWSSTSFTWSERLWKALKQYFSLDSFRPLQLETINATLSGVDVILVMPTGAGKSLCFQLPAVVEKGEGFTLVVSPLVSLMEDQLMAMKSCGMNSRMLNASSSREEINSVHDAMLSTKFAMELLYVTPEKIAKSKRFMAKLEKAYSSKRLKRIVIDEVHCASQWGHDFRPDYKLLGVLKRQFKLVPILGLTATASDKVIDDVKDILCLKRCDVFRSSFNRPNLFYEVRYKTQEVVSEMSQIIKTSFKGMSGIVYCYSQKDAEQVTMELAEHGIYTGCYHANLPEDERSQAHKMWVKGQLQVIVATVAFGMGIDKPDVRFVFHHCVSKSLDNLYQEAGRAGRDGLPSVGIVYFRLADLFRLSGMVYSERTGTENLYRVAAYCHNASGECRRKALARHFGELASFAGSCNMCDACRYGASDTAVDISSACSDLVKLLQVAASNDQRWTALKLLDNWLSKGSRARKEADVDVPSFPTVGPARAVCERVILHALLEGFVEEDMHFTPYSVISYLVPSKRRRPLGKQVLTWPNSSPAAGRIESQLVGKPVDQWSSLLHCFDVYLKTKPDLSANGELSPVDMVTDAAKHQQADIVNDSDTSGSEVSTKASLLVNCPVSSVRASGKETGHQAKEASSFEWKGSPSAFRGEKAPAVKRRMSTPKSNVSCEKKRIKTATKGQRQSLCIISDDDSDEEISFPKKRTVSDVLSGRAKKPVNFIESD